MAKNNIIIDSLCQRRKLLLHSRMKRNGRSTSVAAESHSALRALNLLGRAAFGLEDAQGPIKGAF
jgi:hypothetical protein